MKKMFRAWLKVETFVEADTLDEAHAIVVKKLFEKPKSFTLYGAEITCITPDDNDFTHFHTETREFTEAQFQEFLNHPPIKTSIKGSS